MLEAKTFQNLIGYRVKIYYRGQVIAKGRLWYVSVSNPKTHKPQVLLVKDCGKVKVIREWTKIEVIKG